MLPRLNPVGVLLGAACLLSLQPLRAAELVTAPAAALLPQRICFGSCAHQDRPQPIWDVILDQKPELFLFLGDNIYGDTDDMEVLRQKYALLTAQPGFQKLRATVPLMAVWDDHDYGKNDAGAEYPKKKESQQIFLDVFEGETHSPRREREGVYDAKIFSDGTHRLQVILLDTRYFRSPFAYAPQEPNKKGKRLLPNTDPQATILGATQWAWLESQLREPVDFRLIGSSIQVIPEDQRFEKWNNFPLERSRLFTLIRKTRANGVLFLSGDRHMAEISKYPANAGDGVGYPLFDFTSSGLTHAGGGMRDEVNRHRVNSTNFQERNFGSIEIDWKATEPTILLRIHDLTGKIVEEQTVRLKDLQVPQ